MPDRAKPKQQPALETALAWLIMTIEDLDREDWWTPAGTAYPRHLAAPMPFWAALSDARHLVVRLRNSRADDAAVRGVVVRLVRAVEAVVLARAYDLTRAVVRVTAGEWEGLLAATVAARAVPAIQAACEREMVRFTSPPGFASPPPGFA